MSEPFQYSRSQLIAYIPAQYTVDNKDKWVYNKFNIGDVVTYNGNPHIIVSFYVLMAEPYIYYDLSPSFGHSIPEDELEPNNPLFNE